MLSWALDSLIRPDVPGQQPKLVTGRVTKNLLGVFGGGNRETLEVKLRLSGSAKPAWSTESFDMAMTPTGAAEWNSFLQSNPTLGQPQHVSRVASPAMSQGPPANMTRRDSFGPGVQNNNAGDVQRVAPIPIGPNTAPDNNQGGSSRPSSRASNRAPRKRKPTGRPRGRPRKNPVEGNTSGYEDCTEGEDGPAKKRAKPTKVDKPNPFAAGNESLRVAASTSGSLRNFRPVGNNTEAAAGSHLQEVPRAPTPVPNPNGPGFMGRAAKLRRESTLGQKPMSYSATGYADARNPLSPQDDGRSPESLAPTPAFSEDSPPDIGSSPPVQRATPFLRSSPPPSSPVLPPMPPAKMPHDASFMSQATDLFGEESLPPPQQELPPRKPSSRARKGMIETKSNKNVPVQVFQMQDGPQGQDMVHIYSINSPYPNSTQQAQQQPQTQHQTHQQHQQQQQLQLQQPELPQLKQSASQQTKASAPKKDRIPSPPGMAPTPPPTTDAFEKPPTPVADQPPAPAEAKEVKRIAPEPVALPEAEDRQRPSSQPPASTTPVLKAKKPLARSNSAGPLMLPNMPASEPAGPSHLAQAAAADEDVPQFRLPFPQHGNSAAAMDMVPASDPPAPMTRVNLLGMPEAVMPPSEPIRPPPSSPPAGKSNKNIVKKHAIKQRLEEAIMNGEMPPFCSNCGAIETPTWRKIWIQDRDGVPEYAEYSEKPGRITAIEILQRDANDVPTQHRVIKKGLGPGDDKTNWQELLLCNPCGIWLTKCKAHRPRERWDKDASRLGQERRKRGSGRSKKGRGKMDGMMNPTSEAYFHTDAPEPSSPKYGPSGISNAAIDSLIATAQGNSFTTDSAATDTQSVPGSTHSAASGAGTAKSPIDIELDQAMGTTKRLLFPSPRKPGTPKVLGSVDVNVVLTDDTCRQNKGIATEKENMPFVTQEGLLECDDPEALFRSPMIARPSTPPNAKASVPAEPFKTPTRATPSHRPVTRSVSKSLRTVRSVSSPSQLALLQATPSKTPHSLRGQNSLARRRSPRNHQNPAFDVFDTPISRTINQIMSEPNFNLDSELDLSNLPALESNHDALLEFGNFLSTDGIMPSSPPRNGALSFDYEASWAQWSMDAPNHADNE